MNTIRDAIHAFLLIAALATGFMLAGCDRKETVIEVDTPRGGVEVKRDENGGGVSVDLGE